MAPGSIIIVKGNPMSHSCRKQSEFNIWLHQLGLSTTYQPPFCECTKNVTMSNYEDVRGWATVYERLLDLLDVADEPIQPFLHLAWGSDTSI